MLALIMAGGSGSRLGMGEKGLVLVNGKPMISRVRDGFLRAGLEVVVVTTAHTPYTANWCRVHRIDHIETAGEGYISDVIEAVLFLEEKEPLFTAVCDLPCLRPSTISRIREGYRDSGKEACSTWVPVRLLESRGISVGFTGQVNGVLACAAGVNILTGRHIRREQEEFCMLEDSLDLALHVNTRSDLALAENAGCAQP